MTATEVGGQGRSATIDGTIRPDGWFVVDVTAPDVTCKGINVSCYMP